MLLIQEINDSLKRIDGIIKFYYDKLDKEEDEKKVMIINGELDLLEKIQEMLKEAQEKEGTVRDDLVREAMDMILVCDDPLEVGKANKTFFHQVFESLLK